ncbi:tRNA uracil 4-sulfurtransferase ThiI [Actinopolymorpha alba]|uniref:tRNA uracil 4-sulfurtransferase ThiI n=1 Tax=Actinopolymorpha alba TaxID=533267 RepID=UPI00058E6692|nr:tRNA uracil 4-sulfurtransferase ThiI [Actinopolymorpha alba]
MQSCVLLKYGELALKGRNRWKFEEVLLRNLGRTLADLDGIHIRRRNGVLVVKGAPLPALLERTQTVLGLALVHPAVMVKPEIGAIEQAAVELLRPYENTSFAVRPRRRWKGFELRSQEIAVRIGDRVRTELDRKVDLRNPDFELGIEVDRHEVLLYTEKLPGQGGLPAGVNGRALTLLSGGFDSPVAGYRSMRRGLATDYVHFSGMPFTGPESIYKAYALASRLDRYRGGGSRLWVVSFGNAQRSLATAGAGKLQVLAQRRLMVRVASRLGQQIGAQAIVTGDSLGQVSSQTLPNLVAVEAAAELPLLRPLLGWDKTEIVAEAERIGTAEISRLPDEDCCTLFASPLAETRAEVSALEKIERRLDLDPIVDDLIAAATLHEFAIEQDHAA